jgi:hypothetical protein
MHSLFGDLLNAVTELSQLVERQDDTLRAILKQIEASGASAGQPMVVHTPTGMQLSRGPNQPAIDLVEAANSDAQPEK